MNRNKAFTLIELLLVVAIITLLVALILIPFTAARFKAKDARIKGNVSQLRAIAGMIYDDNSSYGVLCSANTINISGSGYDTQTGAILTDIGLQSGSVYGCTSTASVYCVEAALPSGDYFCIDSTGLATTTSSVNEHCTSTESDCS